MKKRSLDPESREYGGEQYAARMARRFKSRIMPDAPKTKRLVSYEKTESGFYKFTYASGAVFFARGALVNAVIEGKRKEAAE